MQFLPKFTKEFQYYLLIFFKSFSWDIFKVLPWDLCTVKVWSLLKTQSLVCSLTCGGAVDAQHYVVLPHFRMKTRIKILPSRSDSNYSTHILKREESLAPTSSNLSSLLVRCVWVLCLTVLCCACMYLCAVVRGSVTVWKIRGTKTRVVLTFNLLSTHTLDWSFWHYMMSPRI